MTIELIDKIQTFITTVNESSEDTNDFAKRDLEDLQYFCTEADYYFSPEDYEESENLEEIA